MSTLSDSDDSDNEFLLEESIFAKPKSTKKQELTPITTLQRILSGKPTEETAGKKRRQGRRKQPPTKKRAKPKKAKSNSNNTNEILRAGREDDPAWVEAQALKTVEEVLRLDVVDKITDLNDIGWYRCAAKKGKKAKYYPVIVSQNKAEARTLLKSKNNRKFKTKKIQYIGVSWRHALAHEEIALSKWIPYSKSSDSENEERLENFVKAISTSSLFKDDPVSLKIEELAVRKMWEKVTMQIKFRQIEEEKEHAEALESAGNIDRSVATDPPVSVTQDSDSNSHNSKDDEEELVDSDVDDDDYDGANASSSGRKQKKRTPLRLNDKIEFYDSIGTFGNPSSLRRATIVGVRPNASSYPLLLSNTTIPIPATHRVRRLPDGFWQPINDHELLQEGIQSLADRGSGFNEATKRMKKINAEIIQAKDDYWKNQCDAKEKIEKTVDQDGGFGKEEKIEANTSVVNNDAKDDIHTDVVPPVLIRQSSRSSVRSCNKVK